MMNKSLPSRLTKSIALGLGLSVVGLLSPAYAATQTYLDTSVDNVWNTTTTNWDAGVVWVNGNQAIFGGTGETVELSGALSAATLSTAYAIDFTAADYTLADSNNDATLTLSGTLAVRANVAGTSTISENILLSGGGNKSFNGAIGATLVLSGDISEDTLGTGITFTRQNSTAPTPIFVLSGNNTYSGNTTMNISVNLRINSATALGTGDLIGSTSTPGTVDNTSGAAVVLANNNDITFSAGTGSFRFAGSNDLSFGSGVFTMAGADRTIDTTAAGGSGILTIGSIAEDATPRLFTKNGAGTLAITGASTHTNGSTLSAGTIILGNKASLGVGGNVGINGITVSASADLSGANAISNTATLGGNSTFQGSNSIEWSGLVSATGTRSVTNNMTGSAVLTFSNTLSLSTTGTNLTLTIGGTGNTVISGEITNGTATAPLLTKNDAGTLTLTNANTYDGATSVNGGTLLINGNQSGAVGNVTVATGGTLGGIGIVGGATTVNSGGTLSPGSSPGTLTINNNLTLNNGSTYIFEGNDLIDVNGTLDLNDNWTLSLRAGLADGGSITIFTYDSLAATPDLVPTFDVTNLGFTPTDTLTLSIDGNSIVLNGISVIPEPGTTVLLGLGLGLVLFRQLRRRR